MDIVEEGTHYFLQILFYFTAILPLPRLQFLNVIYRLGWLSFLFAMIFFVFYSRMYGSDTSVGGLIGTALFVFNDLANIVTLFEILFNYRTYLQIYRLEKEVDLLITQYLQQNVADSIRKAHFMSKILVVFIMLFICEGLKIWIHLRSGYSPVFWHAMPIGLSLRMRYIQLILIIMALNQRIKVFKEAVLNLATYNQPKAKYNWDIWLPYAAWEYEQLNVMRLIYGRIHETYKTINKCFGWSILAIFMAAFFEFVCNSYWCFTAVWKRQSFEKFVLNGSTTFSWIILVSVLFLYTDASLSNGEDFTLGGLMSLLLFVIQMTAHLVILLDSIASKKDNKELIQKLSQIDLRLKETLKLPIDNNAFDWIFSMIIVCMATILTFAHIILTWTVFRGSAHTSSMFWQILPSTLALQFKMLEFLAAITVLNVRIVLMRRTLNAMGERNLENIFKPYVKEQKKHNFVLVMPRIKDENDERDLIVLKSIYNEIFSIFSSINECYGWSLLAFTLMYFTYFLSNSYGIILAMITQNRDINFLIENIEFLSIAIVFLWVLLWNCQKSYDQSRYIGCIIFKLVKPLGNKSYNDLVTDFSLQTLHQRFVITAKEFFNLNLNLLGSMVAAIVTYLVILIQFMFTEKTKTDNLLTTVGPILNITAISVMQTSALITVTTMSSSIGTANNMD